MKITEEREKLPKVDPEKVFKYPEGRMVGIKTPTSVGGYKVGSSDSYIQFNLSHKPNWFHRTMVKLCFGWEWVNF